MTDRFGRTIDYMRVSVTDRCNLRCKYCMPYGIRLARHCDLLTYEELLRVCRAAVGLGIVKYKLTGGEPLLRRNFAEFAARVKEINGVEQVTLTTNGQLLAPQLDALCSAGLDGVNISLDTLRNEKYKDVTGTDGVSADTVRQTVELCVRRGMRVKVNAVLMADTYGDIVPLAALARQLPVDVRFIELMPIGEGATVKGLSTELALNLLRRQWPDLEPTEEKRGNGPARYYSTRKLTGRIGLISAVSRCFCTSCNRVRLTSTGLLKPCLCYDTAEDLRALLRGGATDGELEAAVRRAIEKKPQAHCFSCAQNVTEHRSMSQIGG
ncbi:GTP 3',8-cyclase MoaA [Clostridium sp. KNHs216]|uniref:GTP 3',8-cyclase MoaA n=1 Tax=Clostridium sp. KNHs216 TaxID=1550235 RepID=UPI001152D59B|nr:GTP 3',8-cyclase MoaA [Clostridium sp. KNHs216]TQI68608.1 cyclic pyranopterin phosphate synthase [Clostridium sp. KNHs216]